MQGTEVTVDAIEASAYTIPTEQPEVDGTLEWDSTTLVIVEARAGGRTGIGYSYTHRSAVDVVNDTLAGVVAGTDAMRPGAAWSLMWNAVRNYGQTGLVATAVSAVDIALWDLKARVLDRPLMQVLDAVHDGTPIYGSGGFCNYTDQQLRDQLSRWVESGIPRVKMKTGRDPARDRERLAAAREAIGDDVELFTDANGAFTRTQALRWAEIYAGFGVRWFEEPVTSDDLAGLHVVVRAPAGMDVTAGEYGWNLPYFQRMLDAGSVDCLQVDVTRCGGVSGFLRAAALCDARTIDVSAHCAPQISAQVCTAVWHLRHRILPRPQSHEHLAFDGCLEPQTGGVLMPDGRGMGLTVKRSDLETFRVR